MDKFFEIINTLKIPTLTLIGICFYTGYSLVKDSELTSLSGMSGSMLLTAGIILAIIIFIDYRYREQSEHIIKQQANAIDNIGRALKNTTDVHRAFAESTRGDLSTKQEKIGKEGTKQYSIDASLETETQ